MQTLRFPLPAMAMMVLTGMLTAAPVGAQGVVAQRQAGGQQTTAPAGISAAFPGRPAFKHRGFYIHCGWAFDHPFAPRSWTRADYAGMFELLRRMGFDTVMYWPQIEAIPAPISQADEAAVQNIRNIISDARPAGLNCWLVLTPNLTSPPEIAAKPFIERNPFSTYQTVHLDNAEQREPFLAHRAKMLSIVNNADAYVTIDGDPGGYAGAKPEDFLRVFEADRRTLDAHGNDPRHQMVVPWIWAGWGRSLPLWQGDLTPFSRATMALLKQRLPEPWQIIPARSHREDAANGRINTALAEELDLVERSMVLCYEAIEFEPTPPASWLQFDLVRANLKREAHLAPKAVGVMGNAQQPIMVLPNLYLFARGSWDLNYLERSDEEVLRDFAEFLGGPAEVLVPAWQCLTLPLERLPRDLPERLRQARLDSAAAKCIPGGSKRYLEILAAQVASRMGALTAIAAPAKDDADCARRLADGSAALIQWWNMHHYVFDGDKANGFKWGYVRGDQVRLLAEWAGHNAKDKAAVVAGAAKLLVEKHILNEPAAMQLMKEMLP